MTSSNNRRSIIFFVVLVQCAHAAFFQPRSTKPETEESSALQSLAVQANGAATGLASMTNELTSLLIATIIGLGFDPLVSVLFNVTHIIHDEDDEHAARQTFLYGAAESVAEGAKACAVVLFVDVLAKLFGVSCNVDLVKAAPEIGFAVWVGLTISEIKKTLLRRAVSGRKSLGRVGVFNRLIDFLLAAGVSVNVLNSLNIDPGMGLKSMFAASGLSALAFSFASKGLFEQIIGGILAQAWDAIEEGESIKLGDGTEGTVVRIGLMETEIVGSDHVSVRIPNAQLTGQRVSNLSRVKRSQVKLPLRMKYADMDRLPKILQDIKDQIQKNCPKLISDGSKPFQVVLTNYEPDHVQVTVNCKFVTAVVRRT